MFAVHTAVYKMLFTLLFMLTRDGSNRDYLHILLNNYAYNKMLFTLLFTLTRDKNNLLHRITINLSPTHAISRQGNYEQTIRHMNNSKIKSRDTCVYSNNTLQIECHTPFGMAEKILVCFFAAFCRKYGFYN